MTPELPEAESSLQVRKAELMTLQVREAESSLQVREAESSLQVREAE